ncbi:hypothetical protein AWN76_006360 [Rhodothermaceae bacterium RA]|nr:hypothetical protein AWN76_006360 [Rhodothermaceae bacterium RA]
MRRRRLNRRRWTTPGAGLMALLLAGGLAACGPETPPLFERRPASHTGVDFVNELPEAADFNILNYLYYYNGGGVAVGDVNDDGLPDLYFTANLGPNRLYLNRGGFRFEDVTEQAGVAGDASWTTGATMADVNGDGRLDLYVTVVSDYLDRQGHNQLFLNLGAEGPGQVPTFSEQAAAYGLDFRGFGTHAAFFDYDRDGDLDVYLLNHTTHYEGAIGRAALREEDHPRAGDRLLRNDGDRFVDVSREAGIYSGVTGYGLSVVVSDLNRDGWPDLYVGNDFHENDYLYLNNGDGTFTEAIRDATGHTSRFSMGSDAADVNRDGWPDLVVLDMLPADEAILKTSASADTYELAELKQRLGYHVQYARNTLQLNRGRARFSEIGYLAGLYATDWSWAALLADYDLDGWLDLFVSNGIYRRPNDLDYVNYISDAAIQASLEQGITEENLTLLERMPQIPLPNAAFRNRGDLTFEEVAAAWGLADPGFSNGAAYADLDNDGDLDLVMNNINEPAWIYENRADRLPDRHALTIRLVGEPPNTFGIGAQVWMRVGEAQLVREQSPARGFQSSVDPRLHVGLGAATTVDTLTVIWPDGRFQTLTDVPADQLLTLRQADAGGTFVWPDAVPDDPLFEDVTGVLAPAWRHEENTFVDFNREALMPHKLSMEGPALAVGDVDGDGLEDVFVGGAKWQAARLFLQQADGRLRPTAPDPWQADSLHEDVDAAFFDADGDGDLDLFVVSGGNEFWGEAEPLLDRLYLNDGRGGFSRDRQALPEHFANGGCVAPGDFDGDGDVDLFVGSRVVSRHYGLIPQSVLYENDGTGRFTDVTHTRAEGLAEAGMVSDAAWTDVDGDGALDLVVVGEWMPVRVFAQRAGRFVDATAERGLAGTEGWWNTVLPYDLDGDGDEDLVLGNLGLNSYVTASPEEPARLYVHDFDGNGSLDQILTVYRHGVSYPIATRDQLLKQIQPLRKAFPTYTAFGARQVTDLFPAARLDSAVVREARTMASAVAWNEGVQGFSLQALPMEAQFAPVQAALAADVDGDAHTDLLLAGNFYGVGPMRGRYDASYGQLLRGDGRGGFEAVPPYRANLWLHGDVRDLAMLRRPDGSRLLVVARNDDGLQLVRLRAGEAALVERPAGTEAGR